MRAESGIIYPDPYPESLVRVLEEARLAGRRVRFHFSDGCTFESEGRIGNTTGPMRCAILLHNRRSMGGGLLRRDPPLKVDCRHRRGRLTLWSSD